MRHRVRCGRGCHSGLQRLACSALMEEIC
jgi:hypothetical protein